MTAILSSSEIRHDLSESAMRVLWKTSGECTLADLISDGQDEALVAKYGAEVIKTTKQVYNSVRAA